MKRLLMEFQLLLYSGGADSRGWFSFFTTILYFLTPVFKKLQQCLLSYLFFFSFFMPIFFIQAIGLPPGVFPEIIFIRFLLLLFGLMPATIQHPAGHWP